jgi:hypothetical protein
VSITLFIFIYLFFVESFVTLLEAVVASVLKKSAMQSPPHCQVCKKKKLPTIFLNICHGEGHGTIKEKNYLKSTLVRKRN